MELRRLALLLLLPAVLVLGPGWSPRFCLQQFLETSGCCERERAQRCCPDEGQAPLDALVHTGGPCEECCIDLSTPFARTLPAPARLADELERAHVVALFSPVEALAPRALDAAAGPPGHAPPAPRGRWMPLPLRI